MKKVTRIERGIEAAAGGACLGLGIGEAMLLNKLECLCFGVVTALLIIGVVRLFSIAGERKDQWVPSIRQQF